MSHKPTAETIAEAIARLKTCKRNRPERLNVAVEHAGLTWTMSITDPRRLIPFECRQVYVDAFLGMSRCAVATLTPAEAGYTEAEVTAWTRPD